MQKVFSNRLLARRHFGFFNLSCTQFGLEVLSGLALLILDFLDLALQLLLGLVGELLLILKLVCKSLVEEVCAFRQHLVAELLGNRLSLRALRTFVDEILQEIHDLLRQRVQSVILVVSEFLCDRLVVLLQEVNTLLLRRLLVFHREHLVLLHHFGLELLDELVSNFADGHFFENVEGHPL